MVGNDAAHKVGVGVPQRRHQTRELLLVELTHGTEHAFARAGAELTLVGRASTHACDHLERAEADGEWETRCGYP